MIELKDGDIFISNGIKYRFDKGKAVELRKSYLGGEAVAFKDVAINQPFYTQTVKISNTEAISSHKLNTEPDIIQPHTFVEINVPEYKNEDKEIGFIKDLRLKEGDVISVDFYVVNGLRHGIKAAVVEGGDGGTNLIPYGCVAQVISRAK